MSTLNPEQLKAVAHRDGPLKIVAGAGTGKTGTLTQRFGYLVDQGVPADRILTLPGSDPHLVADVAAARNWFGTIDVIAHQRIAVPGSVATVCCTWATKSASVRVGPSVGRSR